MRSESRREVRPASGLAWLTLQSSSACPGDLSPSTPFPLSRPFRSRRPNGPEKLRSLLAAPAERMAEAGVPRHPLRNWTLAASARVGSFSGVAGGGLITPGSGAESRWTVGAVPSPQERLRVPLGDGDGQAWGRGDALAETGSQPPPGRGAGVAARPPRGRGDRQRSSPSRLRRSGSRPRCSRCPRAREEECDNLI